MGKGILLLTALVKAKEDKARVRLPRVKGLNQLFFGLVKEILRDKLTQFIILGIVQLSRGASERGEVVQHDELRRRVFEGCRKEWVITAQERQSIDWGAYG